MPTVRAPYLGAGTSGTEMVVTGQIGSMRAEFVTIASASAADTYPSKLNKVMYVFSCNGNTPTYVPSVDISAGTGSTAGNVLTLRNPTDPMIYMIFGF